MFSPTLCHNLTSRITVFGKVERWVGKEYWIKGKNKRSSLLRGAALSLMRNYGRGVLVIGGVNPENAMKRLIRQAVISSEGYNTEEACEIVCEVFKYLIFQEVAEGNKREVTQVCRLDFVKNEIKLSRVYKKT